MEEIRDIKGRIESLFEAFVRNDEIRTPTTEANGLGPIQYPPLTEPETAEVLRFKTDLLAVVSTLEYLTFHYHIDLEYVLIMLIDSRLRWVFANVWRFFETRTLREIEAHADSLEKAATILREGRAMLVHLWDESLQRFTDTLNNPPRSSAATENSGSTDDPEELRLLSLLALGEARRYAAERKRKGEQLPASPPQDLIQTFISEAFEQREVVALPPLAELELKAGERWLDLRRLIDVAIEVTSKAALTFRRRDWKFAVDPDGHPIFRRGRRRTFVLESDCAESMVDFFRHETSRSLYEHVGELLKAVYPETCGKWGDRGKPLRDRVKQLLPGANKSKKSTN